MSSAMVSLLVGSITQSYDADDGGDADDVSS